MEFTGDGLPIAELLDERRHLLDVAYWMVGGAVDAECVVDEAYRRWFGLSEVARAGIVTPRSWLAKTVGAICLARLTVSGRGTAAGPDPGADAAGGLGEEVSRVLLTALDALSPAERAAFVLNDVFGMEWGAVADVVGRTEPECVELADRARRRVRARRSCPTSPQEHDTVTRAVREACAGEDVGLLTSLLCPDATAFFDGGGKVRAPVRPVHGSEQVARSLLTLVAGRPRVSLSDQSVNGRTGLVARYNGLVAAVISLDIADHRVAQAWIVLNPDKLRPWNHPVLEIPASPKPAAP
ncbi:RNA polymerase subunit sigma [Streptomyces sp. NPDC001070]